jgi:site-specific recombinase XerD
VLPEDPEPIEEFLSRIRSEENKHGYYRTLKAFYRFLKKRYQLSNPIEVIEPPRRPKKIMATLELVELMQLLYSATTLRDKAILTLLVDTGMRSSELASLRKKDIGQVRAAANPHKRRDKAASAYSYRSERQGRFRFSWS